MKIYIAGKISKDSVFGAHDWRDDFCRELERLAGFEIINLDPTKGGKDLDQNNAKLIVGMNNSLIKKADVVIAYLSDDISVGGAQEMLIAKYYKRPLIGFAPRGGKFNCDEKELYGKVFKNYVDPYVRVSCDSVAATLEELADQLKKLPSEPAKDITALDDATKYYELEHH